MSVDDDKFPVVVGVDHTTPDSGAVGWAAAVADRLQVPLRIVHAAAPPGYYLSDAQSFAQRNFGGAGRSCSCR